MIGLIVAVLSVTYALGAKSVDDLPTKISGKSAELPVPHHLKCFRTCIRVVATPEIKDHINNVMQNCHVPEQIVEVQRANLGRNAEKMEKVKFTAYMKDPKDYWCIVSWESVLNTDLKENSQVDCNYECNPKPTST